MKPHTAQHRRLDYRLRRGLLEMDLLLRGFSEKHLPSLNAAELLALEYLLDLPDTQLLQVVLGQVAWDDEAGVLAKIRGGSSFQRKLESKPPVIQGKD